MKKTSTLVYPNISLAKLPLSHGDVLPFPEPPDSFPLYSDDEDSVSSNSEEQQPSASRDTDYVQSTDSSKHKITECMLNDLNRRFEIPEYKAEILASRLKEWNLLHQSVK